MSWPAYAQEAAKNDARPAVPVEFPGIKIDIERRIVDLEATVCLNRGALELIACAKGTKEHESIVSVSVPPRYVHLGLLLIGAENGKPANRRAVKDDGPETRWIDLPPSGDPICVFLVLEDASGKKFERPIADFVTRAAEVGAGRAKPEGPFPDAFLFAGSHLIKNEGKTHYLADLQGNVISVSTFGDEVLCLPGTYSANNGALEWEANPNTLPKVGTRLTLRLRPKDARRGEGKP